jgi:hypothetical protein
MDRKDHAQSLTQTTLISCPIHTTLALSPFLPRPWKLILILHTTKHVSKNEV